MHTAYMPFVGTYPIVMGPKLFAVEDDPAFASLLKKVAEALGATLDVYDPDADFDRLPLDGEYDAAIVDYNLGDLCGTQIAALYSETPILLTSISAANLLETKPWPRSVRSFMCKRRGIKALVETGIRLAGGRYV